MNEEPINAENVTAKYTAYLESWRAGEMEHQRSMKELNDAMIKARKTELLQSLIFNCILTSLCIGFLAYIILWS